MSRELWRRDDGWTLRVFSRHPLKVSRIPLTTKTVETYDDFVTAAQAHGYARVTKKNLWLCDQYNGAGWAFRYPVITPLFFWIHEKTCKDAK